MVMMTFQTRLKKSKKPTKPRIRFDLEKLNDPLVMSASRQLQVVDLHLLSRWLDEAADLDSMGTHFNKAVTETAAELHTKQRQKSKLWVTPEITDLYVQIQDLKKERGARRSQRL